MPFRHKYTPIITTPEIKDVTDSEQWILETPLPKEGYGQTVPCDLGDAEIHHATSNRGLSACPVALWPKDGCYFVLLKAGDRRHRCQFFHRNHQQCGTGVYEHDDPTECVVSLSRAQADHLAQEHGHINKRR